MSTLQSTGSEVPAAVSPSATARPRWLFVDGSDVFGGHEVMLLRLVAELERQGRVTPIVLPRDTSPLAARALPHTLSSHSLPRTPTGHFARVFRFYSEVRGYLRSLKAERPEVCVLVDGCLLAQPLLALITWLARRPLLVYVPIVEPTRALGFRSGLLRDSLVRWWLAKVAAGWILLTSDQAVSFAQWARVRRPIFLIPNAVSPEIEALASHGPPNLPDPTARQRILVFGRLDIYQKGLDMLMDFLCERVKREPAVASTIDITLAGNGPGHATIVDQIERCPGLAKFVRVLPWSNPIDMMRAHDALLLPSRFEGVPLVMLEAMALGIPVAASNLPGTRAFLPDTCLFPVGSLGRAFEILETFRFGPTRAEVVEHNRETFVQRASGPSFSSAVSRLTNRLVDARPKQTLTEDHFQLASQRASVQPPGGHTPMPLRDQPDGSDV